MISLHFQYSLLFNLDSHVKEINNKDFELVFCFQYFCYHLPIGFLICYSYYALLNMIYTGTVPKDLSFSIGMTVSNNTIYGQYRSFKKSCKCKENYTFICYTEL